MESKEILHKSPSGRWFRNGIHSLLSRATVRGSADIIYRMRLISLLCRSGARHSYCRQKVGQVTLRILIPTDSIMVFGHFFNLTKKYNLIGRLIRFNKTK